MNFPWYWDIGNQQEFIGRFLKIGSKKKGCPNSPDSFSTESMVLASFVIPKDGPLSHPCQNPES